MGGTNWTDDENNIIKTKIYDEYNNFLIKYNLIEDKKSTYIKLHNLTYYFEHYLLNNINNTSTFNSNIKFLEKNIN